MINDVQKEQMDYFWRKKEFISFVLSILVFFIHISVFSKYFGDDGAITVFNEKMSFFFKESMTRFAVPMYFILSGIVFFRDYNNKKYISKIKSRFFTLCIPYLVWNTLCMLFDIACSYSFISKFFTGRELFTITVDNILEGIFLHKSNIPFWYLLYLIFFVLLSPVFDLLVKNKYIGIVSTVILAVLSVFKFGESYGLAYEAIVFYLLGALLGKHYFRTVIQKTSRPSQIASIAFLLVYILAKNLFPVNEYYLFPFIQIIVFVLAAYSLWSMVDLFMEKLSPRPIYARSFPIYVLHTNVSAIISKIFYFILPKSGYFALPNFLITLILTIAFINVFSIVCERYLPSTYTLLMGKGIKSKQKKTT